MNIHDTQSYPPPLTALLSIRDVAALLGVHRNTIHRLVRTGQLRSVRVGRLPRFRRQDIDEFLERREPPR